MSKAKSRQTIAALNKAAKMEAAAVRAEEVKALIRLEKIPEGELTESQKSLKAAYTEKYGGPETAVREETNRKTRPVNAPTHRKKVVPTPAKVKRGKKQPAYTSIRAAIYDLFASKGCENVTVEEATALARTVKPDTRFDKWHLYFHRKNWRLEEGARQTTERKR